MWVLHTIAAVALVIGLGAMLARPARSMAWVVSFAACAFALAVSIYLALPKAPRPQINIKNEGSSPVLLRAGDQDLRLEAGVVGAFRFDLGERLSIYTRADMDASPAVVVLPSLTDRPEKAMTAEVNADDPDKVSFHVRD